MIRDKIQVSRSRGVDDYYNYSSLEYLTTVATQFAADYGIDITTVQFDFSVDSYYSDDPEVVLSLSGYRWETAKECSDRITRQEEYLAREKIEAERRGKQELEAKERKDKQEFERLKKKFEGG